MASTRKTPAKQPSGGAKPTTDAAPPATGKAARSGRARRRAEPEASAPAPAPAPPPPPPPGPPGVGQAPAPKPYRMPDKVPLDRVGRKDDTPQRPGLLQGGAARGADAAAESLFLPPGLVEIQASFQIGTGTRGDPVGSDDLEAPNDEVLLLELDDGSTLITSAGKLHAALFASRPDLIGPDDEIAFDRLREEGAASRGGLASAGRLVSRLFSAVVGGKPDALLEDAVKTLGLDLAEAGITWAGTKLLMRGIEGRLKTRPGLYRWSVGGLDDLGDERAAGVDRADDGEGQAHGGAREDLEHAAQAGMPILVFIHGTASSTLGSFGALTQVGRDAFESLRRHYAGGVYAFQHRTLSRSPIDNALALLEALPAGSRVSFVSHSRGGLVADLLCLGGPGGLSAELIERYRPEQPLLGPEARLAGGGAGKVEQEVDRSYVEHRAQLQRLAKALAEKRLVVERYVRVASPARGTLLAGGNIDLFLSGLLSVIGRVPYLYGNPLYAMFKRVVLEIVRRRTDPHLVPGLEAMLPDSPMGRLLRDAPVADGIQMAVIGGDVEGGGLLQRLGVLLTDTLIFEQSEHDFVVDTGAMVAGVAPQAHAWALIDRGPQVNHFSYFEDPDTRAALCDWLQLKSPPEVREPSLPPVAGFERIPALDEPTQQVEEERSRGRRRGKPELVDPPIVVLLPGTMGSHLWMQARQDRVWFDPLDIAGGGLDKLRWGTEGVEAEKLFSRFYGDLCEFLESGHRVERFAYDWRQPLDVLGDRLGDFLDGLLKSTRPTQPIRLLAHSMGGLVVRACILKRRGVTDTLMQRDGARLVMLGTPHQGSHSMVENLLGKGATLRSLVRLDLKHSMQEVLDLVAGFRGAVQLLPRPGFRDTHEGEEGGGEGSKDYSKAATWQGFVEGNRDFWFGPGKVATFKDQSALDEASWLWRQDGDGAAPPALPQAYARHSVYVFGMAENTACGVRRDSRQYWKMVGTPRGDGTVTWDSGRIDGIGSFLWMPVDHGKLCCSADHFPAIAELLASGSTARLSSTEPTLRGRESPKPVLYDAGPPVLAAADVLAAGLMGGGLGDRGRSRARAGRRLEVCVRAGDLRFLQRPILLGGYEQDPISGPMKLIDEEMLDFELSSRYQLGLFPGPLGTASAVLCQPNEAEVRRKSMRGAVVTGLGVYDGSLGLQQLTEAVRNGVLRYLLHVADLLGKQRRELPLASVLLGYNSSANLPVATSVEAVVRGVIAANDEFREATQLDIRVADLEIIEIYLDTAITAVYELRRIARKLESLAKATRTNLVVRSDLCRGRGARHRLFDGRGAGYWPRLHVGDAGPCEDGSGRANASPAAPGGPPRGPSAPRGSTAITDRLRFLYVGQRARAESVVLQRQPGLIERLVSQQIGVSSWSEDFSRTLFQLMVPADFKEAARQLERVVLVVDALTANLPWEMMLADERQRGVEAVPLAVRLPMVRQFVTATYRTKVHQGMARAALVIGNPSVEGFAKAFPEPPPDPCAPPPPNRPAPKDPDALLQAGEEAKSVARLLGAMHYEVEMAIGEDQRSVDVLAKLYRRGYRIVHVSAHGVFEQLHVDGGRRSGVVLSDGLLLTAAEFRAMETMPELVFLNCCHLGRIDSAGDAARDRGARRFERTEADGNLLAASVARELIANGVRCVVVAGWAVNDELARDFGERFYQALLHDRLAFGEAVFEARRGLWSRADGRGRRDNTWGAFQAYGDPSWRAEPAIEGALGAGGTEPFVSPDELLDALARLCAELSQRAGGLSRSDRVERERQLNAIRKRCPASWLEMPPVRVAIAEVCADLEMFAEAREQYLRAVSAETLAEVPMRSLEQLANLETRGDPADPDHEARLCLGVSRLRLIDDLVNAAPPSPPGSGPGPGPAPTRARMLTGERSALLGAGLKRQAVGLANTILRDGSSLEWQQGLRAKLEEAAEAYGSGEMAPEGGGPRPYNALNRLWLLPLTAGTPASAAELELVLRCRDLAEASFEAAPDGYNALMPAEARLIERLLRGAWSQRTTAAADEVEVVQREYDEALAAVPISRRERDSATDQLCHLSRLYDACSRDAGRSAAARQALTRTAGRLIELANALLPGSCRRDDRPQPVMPSPARVRGRGRRSR